MSKFDDVAVVFRLRLGPDLLHRLDLLAHLLHAGGENRVVVFDLLLVPATADAEEEAPARDLIDRGDELGGLDRVALDHEADAGRDLEPLCGAGRGGQRHKRVHHVVIALRQLGIGARPPRHRDMRVLGRPDRVEPALLERYPQLGRGDRVIGEKDRSADIHRKFSVHARAARIAGCCHCRQASNVISRQAGSRRDARQPARSASSKRAGSGLSRSSTPTTSPALTSGTTSSEREFGSQAIWPGNSCTSGTITVAPRAAAVPHTPFPHGMRTQAGLP